MVKREDNQNQHEKKTKTTSVKKFKRKKGEFELDAIDPIQDIMSDKELDDAHQRILDALDSENPK